TQPRKRRTRRTSRNHLSRRESHRSTRCLCSSSLSAHDFSDCHSLESSAKYPLGTDGSRTELFGPALPTTGTNALSWPSLLCEQIEAAEALGRNGSTTEITSTRHTSSSRPS